MRPAESSSVRAAFFSLRDAAPKAAGPSLRPRADENLRRLKSGKPVTSDEKGTLSIARRRKRWRRLSWQAKWAVPSRRAHQGRDCGAAEIQRIAENAPRWPDMNTSNGVRAQA